MLITIWSDFASLGCGGVVFWITVGSYSLRSVYKVYRVDEVDRVYRFYGL